MKGRIYSHDNPTRRNCISWSNIIPSRQKLDHNIMQSKIKKTLNVINNILPSTCISCNALLNNPGATFPSLRVSLITCDFTPNQSRFCEIIATCNGSYWLKGKEKSNGVRGHAWSVKVIELYSAHVSGESGFSLFFRIASCSTW